MDKEKEGASIGATVSWRGPSGCQLECRASGVIVFPASHHIDLIDAQTTIQFLFS